MFESLGSLWWALVLIGMGAGILSGALGVGSGIVFVPALVLIFAAPQKSAQGIALAAMVPMALLAAFVYWRDPAIEVDLRIVAILVAGALPGALLGTQIARWLPAHVLRKAFAVFMVIVAVRMFLIPARRKAPPAAPQETLTNHTEVKGQDV